MAKVRKRTWTNSKGEQSAWVAAYKDQDGKQRIKTFKLQRDAKDWLLKTQSEVKDRVHTPDHKSLTVSEVADLWLHQKKINGCRESTLMGCRNRVKNHIHGRAIGKEKLSRLDEPTCLAFHNEIAEAISRRCAHDMLGELREILNFAMRQHFVKQNVAALVRVNRLPKRKKLVGRDIPTKAEVELLIEKVPRGWPRDMLITAAFTGMRSGELRALHWEDVDFEAGVINVCRSADKWNNIGEPKSDEGQRSIRMARIVRDTLWRRAYCDEEDRIAVFQQRLDQCVAEGEALIAAKAKLKRGDWLAWLGENTNRPFRTSRLYMQLARDKQREAKLPSKVVAVTKPKGFVFVAPRIGRMLNHAAPGDMFNALQTKIGLVEVNPARRVGYRSFSTPLAAAVSTGTTLATDVLEGAVAIGEFLFGDDPDPGAKRQRLRRVYRLTSEVKPADQLPVFRIGSLLFARKSTLLKWIADRERTGGIAGR